MAEETFTSGDIGTEKVDTSYLKKQETETLDVTKLTPLSPEVISRQATINIGMFYSYKIRFIF